MKYPFGPEQPNLKKLELLKIEEINILTLFENSPNINELNLQSVKKISDLFHYCKISKLELPNANDIYNSFGCCNELSKLFLPAVRRLNKCFLDCPKLITLTKSSFPSILEITNSFSDCCALTEVELDVGIINNSFNNCTSLTELLLPHVENIKGSFKNCTSLTTLLLPHVENINNSFENCTLLTELSLPSIKKIEKSFKKCTKLILKQLPDGADLKLYSYINYTYI